MSGVAKEVLQDLKNDIEAAGKIAKVNVETVMIIFNGISKISGLDEAFKKYSATKNLADTVSSQVIKTLKDFNVSVTGERLPSFEQIAINHHVAPFIKIIQTLAAAWSA